MVYFAADNDLENDAEINLQQMLKVGSTERVHLLAQIDRFDQEVPAARYFMRESGVWDEEELPKPVNTGSVETFRDFIEWGKAGHEAKRYLIVVWGHAEPMADYEEDESPAVINNVQPEALIASTSGSNGDPASVLFTVATATLASIGLDDHPGDALTSHELKEAIDGARSILGRDAQIVLGMDACMMSMIEIARQVSDSANIMVASEQTIPDQSWQYDTILRKLANSDPPFELRELARTIVDEYITHYQSLDKQVTLSACDLGTTDDFIDLIREFVILLRRLLSYKSLLRALVEARRNTQSYYLRDYVDLYDFCSVLKETLSENRFQKRCQESATLCDDVKAACEKLMNAVKDPTGFVICSKTTTMTSGEASPLANSHGVSIYFPVLPPLYSSLELSRRTHWDAFIREYAGVIFQPVGTSAAARSASAASAEKLPI